MSHFRRLRTLHLPAALWDRDEMDVFFVIGPESDESAQAQRRRVALRLVAARECDAMLAMGRVAPHLRQVSWVRKCHADYRMEECSVQYEIRRKMGGPSTSSTTAACIALDATNDCPVLDVDHICLSQIHPPPRVQELPRRICSPVSGPSFLGYARTSDGFSEFKADHPFVALVVLCLGVICVFGMIGVQAFMRLPSLVGIVHTSEESFYFALLFALLASSLYLH